MAKKTAKKRASKKTPQKKRRTRAWIKVTFEELDAWREARKIPKKKMAEMLKVTNSTYHNWARGIAVATPNTQQRIRDLIDSNGQTAAGPAANGNGAKGANPEIIATTGRIVDCYLQTKPAGMTVERLVRLVREVRLALE